MKTLCCHVFVMTKAWFLSCQLLKLGPLQIFLCPGIVLCGLYVKHEKNPVYVYFYLWNGLFLLHITSKHSSFESRYKINGGFKWNLFRICSIISSFTNRLWIKSIYKKSFSNKLDTFFARSWLVLFRSASLEAKAWFQCFLSGRNIWTSPLGIAPYFKCRCLNNNE